MGKIIAPILLTLIFSVRGYVYVGVAVVKLVELLAIDSRVSGSRPNSHWLSAEVSLGKTLKPCAVQGRIRK